MGAGGGGGVRKGTPAIKTPIDLYHGAAILSPRGTKSFVIPPNSNTFSDWRRACHVSWVKSSCRPRAIKTS